MRQAKRSNQASKTILAILGRVQNAMSTEEIYFAMQEEDFRASIATVYVSLNKLFVNNLIQVNTEWRAKRYELNNCSDIIMG
ncbi:MAG: Fe2+ or Zn2+ uptake regulation protein [Saprospiraceae bacterium]|jgi:Fe2+ or Zn2+ uptake regulation protein